MIIYGIKNCDTIKKSLQWIKQKKVEFQFHDYKIQGITRDKLKAWTEQTSWENLVNKKGTTWRKIDETVKAATTNAEKAVDLMQENPSLIKRPIAERNGKIIAIGFAEKEWEQKML